MTAKQEQNQSVESEHRIPDFQSREEMAEWFDTHDMADYWDQLKPVEIRVAKNLSHALNFRLDGATFKKLREVAAAKGIGPTTLVRMWVMERLNESPDTA